MYFEDAEWDKLSAALLLMARRLAEPLAMLVEVPLLVNGQAVPLRLIIDHLPRLTGHLIDVRTGPVEVKLPAAGAQRPQEVRIALDLVMPRVRKSIERDHDGNITSITEEPAED